MAATDPATLLASANCFRCFQGTESLMMLALLRQIALNGNPMADVSPQALLAQANCYNCYKGSESLLMLALLAIIAGNGGGGGGGSPDVFVGDGPPVGAQPGQDITKAATYYDRQEGYLAYPWDPSLPGWIGV